MVIFIFAVCAQAVLLKRLNVTQRCFSHVGQGYLDRLHCKTMILEYLAFEIDYKMYIFEGVLKSSVGILKLLEICKIKRKHNPSTGFACVNRMRKCKTSCYVCVTAVDKWGGPNRKPALLLQRDLSEAQEASYIEVLMA